MPDDVLIIDDGDRYGRFRLISWWQQEKLAAAKVLVVGAGALGNEVLKNLALLGVGHLYIIDYDTIESSNLTRSVLFRESDAGKSKAWRAAEAVKSINPGIEVHWKNGNVITDLGLGVFAEMDVVIGCLDNREARLWINRQCWKVGRPWVDGAIQEISGVVKVFVPPDSACYECGMTDRDFQLINLKYSCPLLKREDVAEGKVPTAPTISSMIAGLETQEALKLLHGMPVKAGAAMVWNGESNNFYTTLYQRKDACRSHVTYHPIEKKDLGADDSVQRLFEVTGGQRLRLDRNLVVAYLCAKCRGVAKAFKSQEAVTMRDARCPSCGSDRKPGLVHVIEEDPSQQDGGLSPVEWFPALNQAMKGILGDLSSSPLRALGIAPYDIVRIEKDRSEVCVLLDRDRAGMGFDRISCDGGMA
jgi:adenylyltransferase/sulfurtransferase